MRRVLFVMLALSVAMLPSARAAVLTVEDYESGTASGWSNNTVEASGHADYTQFLGRFAGTGGNQGCCRARINLNDLGGYRTGYADGHKSRKTANRIGEEQPPEG